MLCVHKLYFECCTTLFLGVCQQCSSLTFLHIKKLIFPIYCSIGLILCQLTHLHMSLQTSDNGYNAIPFIAPCYKASLQFFASTSPRLLVLVLIEWGTIKYCVLIVLALRVEIGCKALICSCCKNKFLFLFTTAYV